MIGNVGYTPKYKDSRTNFAASTTTEAPKAEKKSDPKNDEVKIQNKPPRQPKKNFWERNLAAIIGLTSIAFVGITLANAVGTAIFMKGNKKNPFGDKLTFENVFKSYTGDDSIPSLDDLPGMAKLKEGIKTNILTPIRRMATYKKHGAGKANGILLCGPPGTGKTFTSQIIAKELDADVAEFAIAKDGSPYLNQASINLRNRAEFVCKHAKENPNKQIVAFFDEIDGMARSRGAQGEHSAHIEQVNTLLTCMDEMKKYPNITILATTNGVDRVDKAILSRLGIIQEVGNPDTEAIRGVLGYHLRDVASTTAKYLNHDEVVKMLEGFSNRDISKITEGAKRCAATQEVTSGKEVDLTAKHFATALEQFRSAPIEDADEASDALGPMGGILKSVLGKDNLSAIQESVEDAVGEVLDLFQNIGQKVESAGNINPESDIDKIISSSEEAARQKAAETIKKARAAEALEAKIVPELPNTNEELTEFINKINASVGISVERRKALIDDALSHYNQLNPPTPPAA